MSHGKVGLETQSGVQKENWEGRHAAGWGIKKTDRERENYLVNFLKTHRHEIGPRVLDAGCGPGNCTAILAAEGFDVTGVDISSNAIENARERLKERGLTVDLEVGDLCELRFEDGEFDTVVNMHVLSHFSWDQAKEAIAELTRVLRHNGLLFLRVHSSNEERRKDVVQQIDDNLNLPEPERGRGYLRHRDDEEPYAIHSYSLSEFKWLAAQNRLEIVGEPYDERSRTVEGAAIPGQWNVVFRKAVDKL